ncbi:MAG: DNA polymerase III subunit delta [Candidatus Yanofskybacteria bacterium RIFCSPHIGHO2_01_FULL_44_17]|uniref:DNA polymerase III subunit delta n=1 Tax=Candidatus Yanofskybacteria bacterium RIFCSPHIGHO2_01_FULL_44_17 TaxID=1802668 RepID=A0A1F8ES08_9BACT|nr:MAG: DNA polymerase III subunit delta [Candidatus Yanofskybacteria bacterium RIFCSPHIGHO2_01_FULL_44_17]
MIIFLYGKDGYRLKQSLDKIIGEYKKKYADGVNFSILDAEDGISKELLAKLENLVKTTSFFNEKRLVIIKNPFLIGKELAALIKKWGLAEDKERILVCVERQSEGELNKKDKGLYALLVAESSIIKNVEPLDDRRLESWITKEAAGRNIKIEPAAIKKLIYSTGYDSWQIGNEIDKLAAYKYSAGNNTVSIADVIALVAPKEDLNIFRMVDVVINKNRLLTARALHDHIESGADPYYIFSMITYQFRNLLRVKDLAKNAVPYAGIIKKTNLNPYVVKKTLDQCKKYELTELKNIFRDLAAMDVAVKDGEAEMVDGLYRFALAL